MLQGEKQSNCLRVVTILLKNTRTTMDPTHFMVWCYGKECLWLVPLTKVENTRKSKDFYLRVQYAAFDNRKFKKKMCTKLSHTAWWKQGSILCLVQRMLNTSLFNSPSFQCHLPSFPRLSAICLQPLPPFEIQPLVL